MSAIHRLAALLLGSTRTVVFTGAGMSTESGIPDFRSPGGIWSRMKPIHFDLYLHNEDARREAWQRTFSGAADWVHVLPTVEQTLLMGCTLFPVSSLSRFSPGVQLPYSCDEIAELQEHE